MCGKIQEVIQRDSAGGNKEKRLSLVSGECKFLVKLNPLHGWTIRNDK